MFGNTRPHSTDKLHTFRIKNFEAIVSALSNNISNCSQYKFFCFLFRSLPNLYFFYIFLENFKGDNHSLRDHDGIHLDRTKSCRLIFVLYTGTVPFANIHCTIFVTPYHTVTNFNTPKGLLKTLWGKGKNAGKPAFFPFPMMFLPFKERFPD